MIKKKMISCFVILSAALSLSACGSASSSYSKGESAAEAPMAEEAAYGFDAYNGYESADMEAEEYDESYAEAKTADDSGSTQKADNSRKLITNVYIDGETTDFDATLEKINTKTNELGGYIESSNVYVSNNYYNGRYVDLRSADFTIRIPEKKLNNFLDDIEKGINITRNSSNVQDVTLEYYDTKAHKEALQTEEAALKSLMEKAETMEDIMAIQSQLTDVRYQLNSIESRLRTMDNQVDYSTVNMSISEKKEEELTVTRELTTLERMGQGFMDNVVGIGYFFKELAIFLVVNLPIFILLIIFGLIVFLIIRLIVKRAARKQRNIMPAPGTLQQAAPVMNPQVNAMPTMNYPTGQMQGADQTGPANMPDQGPADGQSS
ncbi:DUF4349 domain-containing protein [Butyrivibrio sp. MC2013]|uniref:DUF4349 domain-containing protein n=1 Tax=Butyrivibrio sp. MC2013 TaxID=1280686 RepID=UPI00047B83A3|nr:DUF4349 domain-containing protein [Butyrivibrio sp. MC2013]